MTSMRGRVLVVDDDNALSEMLGIVLRGEGRDRQVPGADVVAVTNVGGIEAGAALLTRWR